ETRRLQIETRAAEILEKAAHVDVQLRDAAAKLETAEKYAATTKTSAEKAMSAATDAGHSAKSVNDLYTQTNDLYTKTKEKADAAFATATDFKADASTIKNYAVVVQRLERAVFSEPVILRANQSTTLSLMNIAAPAEAGYALKVQTHALSGDGFDLDYYIGR